MADSYFTVAQMADSYFTVSQMADYSSTFDCFTLQKGKSSTSDFTPTEEEEQEETMTAGKRQVKKKTARACNHCHKAHMTCDDSRPCHRCISRGIAESCVDAPRKRKKYLMDLEGGEGIGVNMGQSSSADSSAASPQPSVAQLHSHPIRTASTTVTSGSVPMGRPIPMYHVSSTVATHALNSGNGGADVDVGVDHKTRNGNEPAASTVPNGPPLNTPLYSYNVHNDPKFLSNAANSEYSILSDILGYGHFDMQQRPRSTTPTPPDLYTATIRQGDRLINQYTLGRIQPDKLLTYPEVLQHIEGEHRLDSTPASTDSESGPRGALSFAITVDEQSEYSSLSSSGLRFKDSEDIYSKVDQPFSYTPGFHSLIRYLKHRFNRQDLIKMAKAMASYRPIFIACTNTLKEDDLIFMEQCFQRTLLEYDKFISISGTPTIVWRRTGQIAYVSEEFCILTGWTKESLLNKVTFIVELMDDNSVVEYFNLFSTIAYGDFRGATMAGCTLITQNRTLIKTTCMWTLKRDVFGIPMMIIGNFLPILNQ